MSLKTLSGDNLLACKNGMKFKYKKVTFDIEGISQNDHIVRKIIKTRCFYEIDLLEFMYMIKNHLHKPDTIAIDVGANIGNHSIFMRSFLADYLIVIEPNPMVLPLLHRNLVRNINNYSIYECAVGETEDTGMIILPEGAENNVAMAKVKSKGNGDKVQITTLDSIIEKREREQGTHGNVAIIKIDVEGMELAVLKGAEKTILKYRPHIFAEADTVEEFLKLDDYLGGMGYRKLGKWAATPVYHFAYNPTRDLILTVRLAQLLRPIRRIIRQITRPFARHYSIAPHSSR